MLKRVAEDLRGGRSARAWQTVRLSFSMRRTVSADRLYRDVFFGFPGHFYLADGPPLRKLLPEVDCPRLLGGLSAYRLTVISDTFDFRL